jgi:hypothetical protein
MVSRSSSILVAHGKQVIVVDRSPERTRFLYNTLQSVYKEDMQVIRAVVVERSAKHSTGEGTVTGECPGSNTENRNPNEGNPDQAIGDAEDYEDDEAEEEMEDTTRTQTMMVMGRSQVG